MSKIAKNIHRGIIALALCFSFMFFVYAPLEVFLGNTTEFWFDITHLIPVIAVCFLISAAVIIIVEELLYKFLYPKSKRAFYCLYMVLFLIFMGLYIQGNYIPRDYGVLNGADIDWSAYGTYAVASIVLWVLVAVVGIILWIKVRKHIFKIGQAVCAAVFVMLLVALISLIPKAGKVVNESDVVVSDEGLWTLSENKNIYVLILDTFDGEYLRGLLAEEGEEYSKLLEDFTFYENAVGGYPTTKPSIPLLLTGEWYENDKPFDEYISGTYNDGLELYDKLQENNYSIGVYSKWNVALNGGERYFENMNAGEYKIDKFGRFASTLYKLIAFEYVPHQLKKAFVVTTMDFEEQKTIKNSQFINEKAYTGTNQEYYKALCEEGFKVESDRNCFRFVHLDGMHFPYSHGEAVIEDGESYTYDEALKGNMNLIKAFLDELKAKGVYDNTAIMILSDHGGDFTTYEASANPLCLIKGFDEQHEFKISDTPVSWEDIYPSLISWVTGEDKNQTVWNISDENRERRFLYYSWANAWDTDYLPPMAEYFVTGNVANGTGLFNNTGNRFIETEKDIAMTEGFVLRAVTETSLLSGDEPDKINIPIDTHNEDFNSIYVAGLGEVNVREDGTKYAWSEGAYTWFKLKPEGEHNLSYTFTLNYDEIYNPNNMDLFSEYSLYMYMYMTINDERQYADDFSETSLSFTVSEEALSSDVVDIVIYYWYATPREEGGEENFLAVTSIDLVPQIPVAVNDKLEVDFSAEGNFGDMFTDGWSIQESNGVWSTSDSTIKFIADNDRDLCLSLDYYALQQDIPTYVKLNGNDICMLSKEAAKEIILPKEYLNESIQTLEFYTPNATSPQKLGISADSRTLGIMVQGLTISKRESVDFPVNISLKKEDNNATDYVVKGFSGADSWGTWTIGNEAVMSFYVPDIQGDLELTMDYMTYNEQKIAIYANDVLLEEYTFKGSENRSIIIPKSAVTDDELTIRMELPTAVSPKELGNGTDSRKLALGVRNISLKTVE